MDTDSSRADTLQSMVSVVVRSRALRPCTQGSRSVSEGGRLLCTPDE